MKCPFCYADRSKVLETRTTAAGKRRRLRCHACRRNFTQREDGTVCDGLRGMTKTLVADFHARTELARATLRAKGYLR